VVVMDGYISCMDSCRYIAATHGSSSSSNSDDMHIHILLLLLLQLQLLLLLLLLSQLTYKH